MNEICTSGESRLILSTPGDRKQIAGPKVGDRNVVWKQSVVDECLGRDHNIVIKQRVDRTKEAARVPNKIARVISVPVRKGVTQKAIVV